ncbi:MAG: hypothetical protein ABI651_00280 [Verrucomicrobiota bacterium]
MLLAVMGGIAWLIAAPSRAAFTPPGELVLEKHFGDYQLKIYRHTEEDPFEKIFARLLPSTLASVCERIHGNRPIAGFEILKRRRRVHSQYGFNFGIAEFECGGGVVGRDITGNGVLKIAVTDQLGRQGGGSLFVFECGQQFRLIADVESLGTYPKLQDLDGDGIPEVIASDNAFYHWPICIDGEPIPEVILRWRNDKYVAAKDLMFKPAPGPEELDARAVQIRASPEWNWESGWPPEALWTNALALIYSGHEALGWKFVEAAWKPGFPGIGDLSKEDIIDYELRGRLEASLYWQNLKTNTFTNSNNQVIER